MYPELVLPLHIAYREYAEYVPLTGAEEPLH